MRRTGHGFNHHSMSNHNDFWSISIFFQHRKNPSPDGCSFFPPAAGIRIIIFCDFCFVLLAKLILVPDARSIRYIASFGIHPLNASITIAPCPPREGLQPPHTHYLGPVPLSSWPQGRAASRGNTNAPPQQGLAAFCPPPRPRTLSGTLTPVLHTLLGRPLHILPGPKRSPGPRTFIRGPQHILLRPARSSWPRAPSRAPRTSS